MRIIKPGTKGQILEKKEITCGECGAELEITKDDLKEGQRLATSKLIPYTYIICTQCKCHIMTTMRSEK